MPPTPQPAVPDQFDDWIYDPPSIPPEALIPGWMWWVLIGTVSIAAFLTIMWIRRLRKIPAPPVAPRSEALDKLDGLMSRVAVLPAGDMGSELASTLNRYLHRRYGELANFRTRDEIFSPRQRPDGAAPLPPGISERFAGLAERCEEMRFAGRDRETEERRGVIRDTIAAMLEESPVPSEKGSDVTKGGAA